MFATLVTPVSATHAATLWIPAQGLRWQYQLQGAVDTTVCRRSAVERRSDPCLHPDVFDIDLYDESGTSLNTAAVSAIHALGAHAVCYVDAGTFENWRPDASAYPASVLGSSNGWSGERWLDIRRTDVLLPIIDARVDKCAAAGFDAVDFDDVEGFANKTGFPLTADDQLSFNRALAQDAHSHGLSVALKNDIDQLGALLTDFDFAINEPCFEYQECGGYDAWVSAGRAVVEVEYHAAAKKFCADAAVHHRDAMRKPLDLRAKPWTPCA